MKKDTSKEIFGQYYESGDRLICVTLNDGEILIGHFIGFFQGDEEAGEPFINRWHFLEKGKESHVESPIDPSEEEGIFIDQKDIKEVEFAK